MKEANGIRTHIQVVTGTAALLDLSFISSLGQVTSVLVKPETLTDVILMQGRDGDDFVSIGVSLELDVCIHRTIPTFLPKFKTAGGSLNMVVICAVKQIRVL